MDKRKYPFSWALIGNIAEARPNLGPNLRIEVYRLMQFCFRDILEQRYGTEEVDKIFLEAGYLAGLHFYENMLVPKPKDFNGLVKQLQKILKDLGVGIFKVEESDMEALKFILTVGEDLDCSGLPDLGFEICIYDEGFLSGIFKAFTGLDFEVKEIDCWCTNERTCRFQANVVTAD